MTRARGEADFGPPGVESHRCEMRTPKTRFASHKSAVFAAVQGSSGISTGRSSTSTSARPGVVPSGYCTFTLPVMPAWMVQRYAYVAAAVGIVDVRAPVAQFAIDVGPVASNVTL